MNEKIYLNIYRSGHVLVSALNVCEIKSPLVHELSQYGCTRVQAEQAVRELARQDDAGWLYVAGVDVDDNDVALHLVLIACTYLLLTVLGSSFVWRALS